MELRQARKQQKLSQKDVAKLVGIHYATVGRYERGTRKMSVETAKKIASALHVDWTAFFEEDIPDNK